MDIGHLQTSSRAYLEWKYPPRLPNRTGWLQVDHDPAHHLYWEEYGTPAGEPVMVLHGGPGGGSSSTVVRFFNPFRYRVILFDQRGCGKSRPNAADPDWAAALTRNTTNDLVRDIDRLRDELNIEEPMHLFGGSWGSTLALIYAIRNPGLVKSLILRGIFLGSPEDLDYMYQGNAAEYSENPFSLKKAGSYIFYPDEWRDYVEQISPENRMNMLRSYRAIFEANPTDERERARQGAAALAWSRWEGGISNLIPETDRLGKFSDPAFALGLARIEAHFFANGLFLEPDYILRHVHELAGLAIHIVHGRFDQVAPLSQASRLAAALSAVGSPPQSFVRTMAGHSLVERENVLALTEIVDQLPTRA